MIHRIKVGNMVVYTGDAGVEQFDNAMRDEISKYVLNLENNLLLKKKQEIERNEISDIKQKQKDLMRAFIKSLK